MEACSQRVNEDKLESIKNTIQRDSLVEGSGENEIVLYALEKLGW